MTIYAHIICPKCHFLYCHHVDNKAMQFHCSRCDYDWREPKRSVVPHQTIVHGEAVANPNVK